MYGLTYFIRMKNSGRSMCLFLKPDPDYNSTLLCTLTNPRGGFRHVQHVWPNRAPHKKGAPQEGANFF